MDVTTDDGTASGHGVALPSTALEAVLIGLRGRKERARSGAGAGLYWTGLYLAVASVKLGFVTVNGLGGAGQREYGGGGLNVELRCEATTTIPP